MPKQAGSQVPAVEEGGGLGEGGEGGGRKVNRRARVLRNSLKNIEKSQDFKNNDNYKINLGAKH